MADETYGGTEFAIDSVGESAGLAAAQSMQSRQQTLEEEKKKVSEIKQKNAEMRSQRKKHESRWFLAGAFLRGQQHVEYNEGLGQLVTDQVPSYRVRLDLNRIRPKVRSRLAKFFKSNPRPVVLPASTELKDLQDARATEKVLKYHWNRLGIEEKHKDVRLWASIASKCYLWVSIDPQAIGRIQIEDPITGQPVIESAPIGDVLVEVGSPFEVLVADPAISRLGSQPRIQRVRMMPKEDIEQRYPGILDEKIKEGDDEKDGQFPDRLATLRKDGAGSGDIKRDPQVMMIEDFIAPCGKYPKGRYAVVVGERLAKLEEELPYEMYDHPNNPFPVVEFSDSMTPGQFWGTTFVEQMIDVQRQYNYLFELIAENVRACARPKIIVYKQHNLPDGAWTTAAGEIVELTHVPGLPPPMVLQPQGIAGDVWNLLAYYDRLFDDITQVYPASEGAVAKSTSGFQTNLLQEATDSVHAPDVRDDELALQELAWKIRRLCKMWYDVPRLFAIMGENSLPESVEFSKRQIDEHAEVRIQIGSMMPELKAAKAQTALEYYKAGLFGDPSDPRVRRRALELVDMGGLEIAREEERRDVDEAERENQILSQGGQIPPAQFFQDQIAHIERHQAFLKSPAFQQMTPQAKQVVIAHVITHYDWVNPSMAMGLRQQYGIMVPIATPPPPPVAPGSASLGAQGAPQSQANPPGNAPTQPGQGQGQVAPPRPGPQRVQ
jgi:hypothetical protein